MLDREVQGDAYRGSRSVISVKSEHFMNDELKLKSADFSDSTDHDIANRLANISKA